jgi:hypothetical protein
MIVRYILWLAAVATAAFSPLGAEPAASTSVRATSGIERVDSEHPVEIYREGETARWRVLVRNPSAKPLVGATLSARLSPWAGDQLAPAAVGVASVLALPALAPGATDSLVMELRPERLGWHEVTFELRDAGRTLLGHELRQLSVGDSPRSTARHFRYGICSHLIRHTGTNLFDLELELARRLGIDALRIELAGWESTEPVEGRFDFNKPDTLLAALAPHGIAVQSILAYSTRWASTGDPYAKDWNEWNKTAPRLAPWLNYVGEVVDRYGDRVRHWEIWNEPDISFWRASTASYVELFDATSALIKEKSPHAQVLNGGLAMVSREPNPDFVSRFLTDASPTHWDIFAYHDYHSFAQFLARRAEVEAQLPALRKKLPLWINEGGSHTLLAGGERAQALTLVKKIATAPAFGVEAYFWYNLRDDGEDPADPEHHFGLARHDGQPKPAWSAYQALIRELGAARYLRSMPAQETPPGVWAHLYQRSADDATSAAAVPQSSHVLVLWQEGSARRIPHWLDVGRDARVVGVRDLMGNPAPASLSAQGAMLTLTEEPVYVQIESARTPSPALSLRPLIELPSLATLVPGQSSAIALRLHNPSAQPVTMRAAWESSLPGLRIESPQAEFNLPARGRADAPVLLRLDATPVDSNAAPRIGLRLTIPETGFAFSAQLTATIALPIPASPASASLALEHRDDIHNLYSAEPLPAMQWRGPADLSATLRLAHDKAGLDLTVVARDDLHRQSDVRDKLWAADSLQIGLRLDDTRTEYVEIGLARAEDGKVGAWVFATDSTFPIARGQLGAPSHFAVTRDEIAATTTYRLQLPWSELGRAAAPSDGFRFNLIVNDDDGAGRKQWVRFSEGLGEHKTPGLWRVFICR